MQIRVIPTVEALEAAAAAHAASTLVGRLGSQASVRLIAATGSSQIGFLERLVATPGIDWTRVELFHLDEYLGLPADHPGGFRRFIIDRIVQPTGIKTFHLIDGTVEPTLEIGRLTALIGSAPVDLAFTGIGENGHLAFNEPPADFETAASFVVVDLDDVSRRQQVGERWFARLEDVPSRAITMTIPQILRTREILCLAHGTRKARAVAACFGQSPSPMAPASRLASHPGTTVYLDQQAAAQLSGMPPSPVA
jgi:glucosamine-6-phosphate deaminase